jgi:modification methylase
MVVTARPWRRDGKLPDLPSRVIDIAEAADLIHTGRHVAHLAGPNPDRLPPRASSRRLQHLRRARRSGITVRLKTDETTLVFTPRRGLPDLAPASMDGRGRVDRPVDVASRTEASERRQHHD